MILRSSTRRSSIRRSSIRRSLHAEGRVDQRLRLLPEATGDGLVVRGVGGGGSTSAAGVATYAPVIEAASGDVARNTEVAAPWSAGAPTTEILVEQLGVDDPRDGAR